MMKTWIYALSLGAISACAFIGLVWLLCNQRTPMSNMATPGVIKTDAKLGDKTDVTVSAVATQIKSKNGCLLGFHVEIINRSKDQCVILSVKNRNPYVHIHLYDEKGDKIEYMTDGLAQRVMYKSSNPNSIVNWCSILPGDSHGWFVDVPNNAGLKLALPKAKYFIELNIEESFYTQKLGEPDPVGARKYNTIKVVFPKVESIIDARGLGAPGGLADAYLAEIN